MRKFISNIALFTSLILLVHVILAFLANGSTDSYYSKFTSPKQNSLILGTSRASQGVMPSVLDSIITNQEIYNYAFTIGSSPYGKSYYEAIKKKLVDNQKKGYFILTVDPWSLSAKEGLSKDNMEKNSVLYGMHFLSSNPNFEYLLKKYQNGWGTILIKNTENYLLRKFQKKLGNSVTGSFSHLHNNGWLEVYPSGDSTFIKQKTHAKISDYKKTTQTNRFSEYRYRYLIKTIEMLKEHGDVYLVRLPVHPQMLKVENSYTPHFTSRIESAINLSEGYLDMNTSNSVYQYTDGNHLHKKSSKLVSKQIGEWIKTLN